MTPKHGIKAKPARKPRPPESGEGRLPKRSPVPKSDGEALSAEGLPLRSYPGWDEAAGVFVQDDPRTRPQFSRAASETTPG